MKTFLKPLTSAEEKLCLKRCWKGDPEAKRILIEHNLRLVAHVAKKYQNTGEDLEDLISIGTIGLSKQSPRLILTVPPDFPLMLRGALTTNF